LITWHLCNYRATKLATVFHAAVALKNEFSKQFSCSPQSWRPTDGALELCPRQQIAKSGLQEVRFGFAVRGGGVPYIRNRNHALLGLIARRLRVLPSFYRSLS
jgi:hypothetical protein